LVFLTGDVHHGSLRTKELPYILPKTELDLPDEYLSIAAEFGIKVTLFVIGKTFLEEREKVKRVLAYDNLEIGGHTFDGFSPTWLHRFFKLTRGTRWRSCSHQRNDVKNTIKVAYDCAGIKITSWRNHCYEHDRHTQQILKSFGIKVWSDELDLKNLKPYKTPCGIISMPVNIIQDHNRLYHGYMTEEWHKGLHSGMFQKRVKKRLDGNIHTNVAM